ncbi:MAG: NAD-dependent epimerase/dehydratase family protein [Candidatus Micrarchaeota archaeon]
MAKTVVTGGAGFIGSHVAELLAQRGDVVVVDDLSSGKQANLPKTSKIKLVNANFTDSAALEELKGASGVFHLAGIVGVPYSLEHAEETRRVNVDGTAALLEACEAAGVRSFVFASSASVYGNAASTGKQKQKESDALRPESPYAESKVEGEKLVARASKKMRACSLRLFNVYGPRQQPGGAYAAAIPTFIDAALHGREITVFGGAQTRDFVFVRDVARAFVLAAERGGNGKAFNVATGKSVSVIELAGEIVSLAESSSKIVFKPERSGEVRFSEADVSLASSELGFKAECPLEAGLEETLEYFKKLGRN